MSHPSSAPQILSPNLIPWLLDQASTAMLTICQSRVGDGLHPVQGPIVPLGSTGFLLWGRSSRWTPSCSRDPVPVIQLRLSPLCGYMGPFVPRGFSLCLPRPFITPIMVVYMEIQDQVGKNTDLGIQAPSWSLSFPICTRGDSCHTSSLPMMRVWHLGVTLCLGLGQTLVAVC